MGFFALGCNFEWRPSFSQSYSTCWTCWTLNSHPPAWPPLPATGSGSSTSNTSKWRVRPRRRWKENYINALYFEIYCESVEYDVTYWWIQFKNHWLLNGIALFSWFLQPRAYSAWNYSLQLLRSLLFLKCHPTQIVPFNWEGLRRFLNLRKQFPSSIKKTASIQQQLVQQHAFHYIQSWIWRKKQQNANSNWSTLKVVLAKWNDDSCPELGFTGHRPQPNAYLCPMQPLYWALKLW